MFTSYILPFEMVAMLLLVALIGALVLARPRSDSHASFPTGVDTSPERRLELDATLMPESKTQPAPESTPEPILEP